ncbi:MAG: hypothetical protein H6R19_1708 [Proteobacteria bacterium]|nr:hypothetical protein [Pseudomonadota bacterium]
MGVLILVALLGVMGYFLFRAWRVWQERFAHRHEFDAEHFALLMAQREEIDQISVTPSPAPRPVKLAHPNKPPAETPPPAQAHPVQTRHRQPLLDATAQEVFQFLRTSLPNTPILAGVDIVRLLDPDAPPPPRVQADFVLCKKDFIPAVVIFIERDAGVPLHDRAEALLRQQRLRVLRWRAGALPSHEQMHLQIFKPKTGT